MHKSYQSILPSHNKLLQQRWDRTYYDEHRKKVKEAAPMVDTKAPVTYMHLHVKLKKLQLEEERLATIERDNRILLEKMSIIMRTKGSLDNLNNYEYKSLNREKRQRELLRITRENRAILKRILVRKPEYGQEKWQKEWADNQLLLDNISHYPPDWWLVRAENSRLSRKGKGSRDSASARSGRNKSGRKSEKKKPDDENDDAEPKNDGEDLGHGHADENQEKEETDKNGSDVKKDEKVKQQKKK